MAKWFRCPEMYSRSPLAKLWSSQRPAAAGVCITHPQCIQCTLFCILKLRPPRGLG